MIEDELTIHAAGLVMHYNTTIRQRCMWCGAALISQDLAMTAVALSPDDLCDHEGCDLTREEHGSPTLHSFDWAQPSYPTWEPGSFVAHGGGVSYPVLGAAESGNVKMSDLAVQHKLPVCLLLPDDWTQ